MSNRLNYYFRQKVSESELDSGFALLEKGDQNLMLDMFQTGVLSGQVVTQRGAGTNLSVDVSSGVSYDKDGRRIQFSATQNVSVAADENAVTTTVAAPGNSKIISVFAKFKRVLTDPRTDGNSVTVYFSEDEGFEFIVRQGSEGVTPSPVALDTSMILLADITRVFGDTVVTNAMIDTSSSNRREEPFKVSGAPHRLQRGSVKNALSDVLGWLNTEIADRIAGVAASDAALAAHIALGTDVHDASAISYATSGNWADASAVASTDVESALDEIVADLAATTGDVKIGSPARSGSYCFSLSAGSIGSQFDELLAYLDLGPNARRVESFVAADSPVAMSDKRQLNVDTTAGAISLQLPNPASAAHVEFYVNDSADAGSWGTNNVTLVRNGSEKIQGVAASRVFAADYGAFRVYSNGTDWFIG